MNMICHLVLWRRDSGSVPGLQCSDGARSHREAPPPATRTTGPSRSLHHEVSFYHTAIFAMGNNNFVSIMIGGFSRELSYRHSIERVVSKQRTGI